jgi:hypothetical protein
MADHFADRYWGTRYWTARYFQGGEQAPGAMQASLAGSGSVSALLTSGQEATRPAQQYGGGNRAGAPMWPGALESLLKKKKPKKAEVIEEIAEVVEQAAPQVTVAESKVIAQRIYAELGMAQLRRLNSIEAFVVKVEVELAEMDDEEVLLLAA